MRCHHAVGEDEAYIRAAIAGGFDVLGFADHAPWPYTRFVSNIRMTMDDFPDYLHSLRRLREAYRGQLELHIGLESEYFPTYADYLRRLAESGDVDYLILGAHYTDSEEFTPYVAPLCREDDGVRQYAENCIRGMETGLFRYIAHPDLFMRPRHEDDFNAACQDAARDICLCAKAQGMPIEFNLLGLQSQLTGAGRGYPSPAFWNYVKPYAGDVILGVDAHDPAQLSDTALWDEGLKRLHVLGYTPVDHLTWTK